MTVAAVSPFMILFAPAALLVEYPLAALGPAAAFGLLWRRYRHRVIGTAAVAWLLYASYEWGMKARWLCSGECNIRVDLLLIYPALVAVTGLACLAAWRARGGAGGVDATSA